VIRAKRRTYKLRITHISGEFFPPPGCNSLPPEPFGRKLRPLPPCRRPCSHLQHSPTVMHRRTSNHVPSWPTYLVADISNPLAPVASFNHRYIVPPSATEHFRLLVQNSTVGGDVTDVAGDPPQTTEDLLVCAVIFGHIPALILFYCFDVLLYLFVVRWWSLQNLYLDHFKIFSADLIWFDRILLQQKTRDFITARRYGYLVRSLLSPGV